MILVFEENEYSILTHDLKYLPNNVLQLMPMRIRNFGKSFVGKEVNPGALGNKANSMNLMTFGAKSQTRSKNARSGKNATSILKNKSTVLPKINLFLKHQPVYFEKFIF